MKRKRRLVPIDELATGVKRHATSLDAANTRALHEDDAEHEDTGPRMSESRSDGDRFDEAEEYLDPYGVDDDRAEREV